jgi:hypothetical protein
MGSGWAWGHNLIIMYLRHKKHTWICAICGAIPLCLSRPFGKHREAATRQAGGGGGGRGEGKNLDRAKDNVLCSGVGRSVRPHRLFFRQAARVRNQTAEASTLINNGSDVHRDTCPLVGYFPPPIDYLGPTIYRWVGESCTASELELISTSFLLPGNEIFRSLVKVS